VVDATNPASQAKPCTTYTAADSVAATDDAFAASTAAAIVSAAAATSPAGRAKTDLEQLERNLIIVLALAHLEKLAGPLLARQLTSLAQMYQQWHRHGQSCEALFVKGLGIPLADGEADRLDNVLAARAEGLLLTSAVVAGQSLSEARASLAASLATP
jgi:hypothetical protein